MNPIHLTDYSQLASNQGKAGLRPSGSFQVGALSRCNAISFEPCIADRQTTTRFRFETFTATIFSPTVNGQNAANSDIDVSTHLCPTGQMTEQ